MSAVTHSVDAVSRRVHLPADLGRATARDFGDQLLVECRRGAGGAVVLDGSSVTDVDMVGVAALIGCRRRAAANGKVVVLCNPSPALQGALARAGLTRCFSVEHG